MKSFTAKEFSRCPAKVYEAAREDGKVEITHDRFKGGFFIYSSQQVKEFNPQICSWDEIAQLKVGDEFILNKIRVKIIETP